MRGDHRKQSVHQSRAERRVGARLSAGLHVVWRNRYGPARERLSVCLFIGALGVNFRICRDDGALEPGCERGSLVVR
jgi:hypothetical protein